MPCRSVFNAVDQIVRNQLFGAVDDLSRSGEFVADLLGHVQQLLEAADGFRFRFEEAGLIELFHIEIGRRADVFRILRIRHDEGAGLRDARLPLEEHLFDFIQADRRFAAAFGRSHQIPEHRIGHAVGAEDHPKSVRGNGGVRQIFEKFRLVLDVLFDLEEVVLVGVSLNVVFETGGFADLGEGEEEAVGIHHEVLVPRLLVDLGKIRGPAALRVPAGFRTNARVFLPGFQSVFEGVQTDLRRNVRKHHVNERRRNRFDLPFLDQLLQKRQDGRRLLIHHFQRPAGGLERDFVIAVAHQLEQRTIAVFTDPRTAFRVQLRILNIRMRHENDFRFIRHELSPLLLWFG